MREFRTDPIMAGDHFLLDGVEYVAEEDTGRDCDSCALYNSDKCYSIPCDKVIFKRVEKKTICRPYKDTEEMIADYKEHFDVSNVPSFCMPLIWVKYKNGAVVYRRLITAFTDSCVGLDDIFMSVRELFDGYTYLDGSPCGKVEE